MRHTHVSSMPSSFRLDYLYDKTSWQCEALTLHKRRWHYL